MLVVREGWKGAMSPEDFEYHAGSTALREPALTMARLVLVEGVSVAEAARRHNRGRSTAQAAAARVLRARREYRQIPPDWLTITVTLPEEAAARVVEIEQQALRESGIRR